MSTSSWLLPPVPASVFEGGRTSIHAAATFASLFVFTHIAADVVVAGARKIAGVT